MKKLLFIGFLSSIMVHTTALAQCPNSGCDAATDAEATSCLSSLNTELNITDDLSILPPNDLSGISVCIKNATLTIDPDVNVSSTTEFSANGTNGITVVIDGVNYDFNNNTGALDDLNTTLAALGGTSSIGAIAQQLLPVSLLSYNGVIKEKSVQLVWTTAAELNNAYFVVEHSSNGRNFTEIVSLEGQGTTDVSNHYAYTHASPVNGKNYYRLWQIDFDGQTQNLGVVHVNVSKKEEWSVYPNPAKAGTLISLNAPKGSPELPTVYVTNLNGQTQQLEVQGQRQLLLPDNMSKGVYFLQFDQNGQKQSTRISVH